MVIAIAASAVNTGVDEPPGITAFKVLPSRIPPAISNKSLKGIPIGTSKFAGLFTWPVTENNLQPPEFATPISANHCPPFARISGTEAKLSVLLIVVGIPNKPIFAGNGGLNLGWPFLPSSDSRSAVSSPQI